MKGVWIAGIFALVLVGALALYATSLVNEVRNREDKLSETLQERTEDLRALDRRYPYTPRKTLDPARMPLYLEVRKETARVFRKRIDDLSHGVSVFHAKETRNEVLLVLTRELNARKMSLAEYRAITARWQSLLARGDRLGLTGEWRRIVTSEQHPKGLPLPEPAKDTPKAELELFRASENALAASLHADLLVLPAPLSPRK